MIRNTSQYNIRAMQEHKFVPAIGGAMAEQSNQDDQIKVPVSKSCSKAIQ
jgi:hypothetical protein